MERRELDRHAGAFLDRRVRARGAPDRVDRRLVRREIARRVVCGARGLAQHVVREPVAGRLALGRALDRGRDPRAHDELLGQDHHRRADRAAPPRLARARDEAPQDRGGLLARLLAPRGERPGEHQAPGRGVQEQAAVGLALGVPARAGELVADQRVRGVGVGDAQERLGEAHEDDALARGQREAAQERFRSGRLLRLRADAAREFERALADAPALARGQVYARPQRADRFGFVLAVGELDRLPERGGVGGSGARCGHRVSRAVRRNGSAALARPVG
ncbi:MAG: hypothetical protein U1F45_03145 [Burkholderiales bacterium]